MEKPKGNPNLGIEGKPYQFKKDDPRINRNGRPKGIFKQLKEILKKDEDYNIKGELTLTDYKKLCRWMMELNEDEIGKLAQDKKTPIFIKMLCFAIAKDIKQGKLDVFDNIYDKFIKNANPKEKSSQITFVTGFQIEALQEPQDAEIIEGSEE